ncbi:MAG: hypothetical protein JWN36_876 [Microbacteriaceae bacterium]|nr:hypothetical protein [Microbacteriaceae bacterium]
MATPDLRDYARRLVAVARDMPGLPIQTLESVTELAEVGEPVVGFEILCDQLFEYDIPLSSSDRSELRELGSGMGIERRVWALDDNPTREH